VVHDAFSPGGMPESAVAAAQQISCLALTFQAFPQVVLAVQDNLSLGSAPSTSPHAESAIAMARAECQKAKTGHARQAGLIITHLPMQRRK